MDKPPREPAAVTLADLITLVLGVALVLTAVNGPSWLDKIPDSRPRWLVVINHFLAMACASLIPVILARRFRYGGLARPAEFLAACCGLPLLASSLDGLLFRAWVRLRIGDILVGLGLLLDQQGKLESDWWQLLPYWGVRGAQMAAAVLAAVAFRLGRRRLPGWLLTALLMIAWAGTFHGGLALWSDFVTWPLLRRVPLDNSANLIQARIYFLTYLPLRLLLYAVPALVAIRDFRSAGLARRTWLEWTGLALAAILLTGSEVVFHIDSYPIYSFYGIWVHVILFRDLAMLATVALCIPIARRLGPAWSRLEMPRYPDTIGERGPTVL